MAMHLIKLRGWLFNHVFLGKLPGKTACLVHKSIIGKAVRT